MTRALARYGPPLAWMGVIALLSGERFGADPTGAWLLPLLARLLPWAGPEALHGLHAVLRKLGHLFEYGILAALWLRALGPDRPPASAAGWAVSLSTLYAVADELRQGLAANRTSALVDVVIDAVGALVAVAALQPGTPLARRLVRVGVWVAGLLAAASLGAAAVDWSLGLPAWDLLLGAVGAAVAAWGLGTRWRPRPHASAGAR
ncbi:MAG: VanZ family protein [Candidatus Rokubacteria bacterium]|nr:VanZ family protein [Candidatus Rokubacteria bacterium]